MMTHQNFSCATFDLTRITFTHLTEGLSHSLQKPPTASWSPWNLNLTSQQVTGGAIGLGQICNKICQGSLLGATSKVPQKKNLRPFELIVGF